jgi:hypothetical protein
LPIKFASKKIEKEVVKLVDNILLLNQNLQKAKTGAEAEKIKDRMNKVDQKIEKRVRQIYGFE